MSIEKFSKEWLRFNTNVSCVGLDSQSRVALFRIYYENHTKQEQLDNMGFGNLIQSIQSELGKLSEGEEWRGDEH